MTIKGETEDLGAAVELLRNKGYSQFAIVAASFGAGSASYYIPKHQDIVNVLVLWNPSIDYGSRINAVTAWGKKYWGKPAYERAEKFGFTEIGSRKFKVGLGLLKDVYALKPWKELLRVTIPVLFIHGDQDTYVPYKDSVKYSGLIKSASLVTVKGAEHGFRARHEDARQANRATIEFIQKNFN
jgi:pimeloyl-ACP methyl ester carboxylesterase